MRRYLIILFTALGGSMALVFLLTLVFNASIVLQSPGITVAAISIGSLLIASILQKTKSTGKGSNRPHGSRNNSPANSMS